MLRFRELNLKLLHIHFLLSDVFLQRNPLHFRLPTADVDVLNFLRDHVGPLSSFVLAEC